VTDIEDKNAIHDQFISSLRDGSDKAAELGGLNQLFSESIKLTSNPQQQSLLSCKVYKMFVLSALH